jgi:hypothetical protein
MERLDWMIGLVKVYHGDDDKDDKDTGTFGVCQMEKGERLYQAAKTTTYEIH